MYILSFNQNIKPRRIFAVKNAFFFFFFVHPFLYVCTKFVTASRKLVIIFRVSSDSIFFYVFFFFFTASVIYDLTSARRCFSRFFISWRYKTRLLHDIYIYFCRSRIRVLFLFYFFAAGCTSPRGAEKNKRKSRVAKFNTVTSHPPTPLLVTILNSCYRNTVTLPPTIKPTYLPTTPFHNSIKSTYFVGNSNVVRTPPTYKVPTV